MTKQHMRRFLQKQYFATFLKIVFIRVLACICLSGCLAKTRVSQNTHTLLYLSVCCVAKILERRLSCKTTLSATLSCKNNPCIKQTCGAQASFFREKNLHLVKCFDACFLTLRKLIFHKKYFFSNVTKVAKDCFCRKRFI